MSGNNKIGFFDAFKIDANQSGLEVFNDAVVEKVSIDKKSGVINAYIQLNSLCPEHALRVAEKLIGEKYRLKKARINPRYPEKLFCDEYCNTLTERLKAEYPSLSGILSGAAWHYSGNTLEITLKNGDAQFFSPCIEYIRKTVFDEFGLSINVQTRALNEAVSEQEILKLHKKRGKTPPPPPPEKRPEPGKKPRTREAAKFTRTGVDGELVIGKPNFTEFVPIKELCEEYGYVSVKGDIFAVNHRVTPERGTSLLSFDITDYTGSIRVIKALMSADAEIPDKLKPGIHVCVYGVCTYDTYLHDVVLRATNIVICEKRIRKDTAPKKRVELHMHTNMSAMDGIASVSDIVRRAAYWGHKAVAVTDHGVVQSYPDAMKAAKEHGVKIIYGMEAYYLTNTGAGIVSNNASESLDGEFVCFDIETTGLNPKYHEIIEIAAVVLKKGELCEEFHAYIKPRKPVPEFITGLTGISNETVADADTIENVLPEFLDFIKNRCLVAHNAEFDMGFIREALKRQGILIDLGYMDTLALSRTMLPELSSHKLNTVAEKLNLPQFTHHRATDDAKTVAYMLKSFFETLSSKDVKNISELNTYFGEEGVRAQLKAHPYHLLILVKNLTGLKNLYKLVSYSHLNYYYRKPIILKRVLSEHREGLIIGTACEAGELYTAILRGAPEHELTEIARFYDFLEIQPIDNNAFLVEKGMVESFDALKEYNRRIAKLSDTLGIPLVATGDVHFLDTTDEIYRRIIMTGMSVPDADKQSPLYFKTTDEMLEEFSYLGRDTAIKAVVENPNMLADMCEEIRPIPEGQFPPAIEGSKQELERLCRTRAEELYGKDLPEIVSERMEYELSKIIGHDFDVMYMIAQKLVSKSLEDGYIVGSRGSVGSSFVAYLAGITEVNALMPHYLCPKCKSSEFVKNEKYAVGADLPDKTCACGERYIKDGFDIPFQTFLGFDGDKTPDIDLNFSGEYQARAHRQTIEIFGEDNVFRAGTIGTIQEKTAFGFVKKYIEQNNLNVSRSEINRLTKGCTGIKRTTGQHPGGVMILPKDKEIYDFTPVQHPADKTDSKIITTHFDFNSIHDNLLKLDLLGHDNPTIIKKLEDLTGKSSMDIPLDDPAVMSIFSSAGALGIEDDEILGKTGAAAIPEYGTKFVREMLLDTKPATFDELVRISGLSHGTDVWINNAQELIKSKTATLKEVICTRDDIMLYLMGKGLKPKLAFTIMESVRKGRGLKPEWEEEMKGHDIPGWYLDSCRKIKYMFPKAHAVAYAMMAFRIAWYKVYEPLAFYAAFFSIRARAFDAMYMASGDETAVAKIRELNAKDKLTEVEKDMLVTLEVCHEFYLRGFKFDRIDLYKSEAKEFLITENGLLPPFTAIPGLGEVAAGSIIAEREKAVFSSAEELQFRCEKVSKAVIELLEKYHVLDKIPKSNQISFFG